MIENYRDIAYELRKTAGEWYDGDDSAMYRFWMGKPCDPVKLAREAANCAKENNFPKWEEKLAELVRFAEAEAKRAAALRKMEAAIVACYGIGIEGWQVEAAAEKALAKGRAAADEAAAAPRR